MAEHPEIDELWDEFHSVVNMSSRELREWLATDAAAPNGVVHEDQLPERGQHVAEILSKRKTDLNDDDISTMRSVVDTVHTLDPDEKSTSAGDESWRHRLMRIGHDPLKPAHAQRLS